jgi:hypothetical protein
MVEGQDARPSAAAHVFGVQFFIQPGHVALSRDMALAPDRHKGPCGGALEVATAPGFEFGGGPTFGLVSPNENAFVGSHSPKVGSGVGHTCGMVPGVHDAVYLIDRVLDAAGWVLRLRRTRGQKAEYKSGKEEGRFLIHVPKVGTTFAAWFGSVVQWIVCGFPEPKMQVRFLPGLQIRGAMRLSGKTASSRTRWGGFLLRAGAKCIFSFGGIFAVYVFQNDIAFSIHRTGNGRGHADPGAPDFRYRFTRSRLYRLGANQAHF